MEDILKPSISIPTVRNESDFIWSLNRQTGRIEKLDLISGNFVEQEVDPVTRFIYTSSVGEAICNGLREGMKLDDIVQLPNAPAIGVILHWRRTVKVFAMMWRQAIKDRAEIYHDRAIAVLENLDQDMELSEDERDQEEDRAFNDPEAKFKDKRKKGGGSEKLEVAKFKFASYIKLAEKGDPDRYTARPEKTVNTGPTTIMINTGLPSTRIGDRFEGIRAMERDVDNGRVVDAECTELNDVELTDKLEEDNIE